MLHLPSYHRSLSLLGFNGHKPSSLIEGEWWLDKTTISKIYNSSVDIHSPFEPETVVEQSLAIEHHEQLQRIVHGLDSPSLLWIYTNREPFCGTQREAVDSPEVEVKCSICDMNVINRRNETSVLTHTPKPETAPTLFDLEPQHCHGFFPSPPLIPPLSRQIS